MLLKELFSQITAVEDGLYKSQLQQEMVLEEPEKQANYFNSLPAGDAVKAADMRRMTNKQLWKEVRQVSARTQTRYEELARSQQQILRDLCKERERNQYLQQELSHRDNFSSPQSPARSAVDDLEGDAYIQELEGLLQNARSELLSTKLQLSDYQVENLGLKN